jgi:hypothetical protein
MNDFWLKTHRGKTLDQTISRDHSSATSGLHSFEYQFHASECPFESDIVHISLYEKFGATNANQMYLSEELGISRSI